MYTVTGASQKWRFLKTRNTTPSINKFDLLGTSLIFAALMRASQSSLIIYIQWLSIGIAEVAHLVEHDLAKVGVAGSSPVFRSVT